MAFVPDTFGFLTDLAANNERAWFTTNKPRYEASVRAPAIALLAALREPLDAIVPGLACDARAIFRPHRDTRFSADKSPYKTHAGLHLRDEAAGRDVHTPGLYLHIQPGACFFGAGVWQPDRHALAAIRADLVAHPSVWADADRALTDGGLRWDGATLQRAPAGFSPDHPQIDALRRKDHVVMRSLPDAALMDPALPDTLLALARAAAPMMLRLRSVLAPG